MRKKKKRKGKDDESKNGEKKKWREKGRYKTEDQRVKKILR